VLETIVLGQTADISPFAEYKWYEWVMYNDHMDHGAEAKWTLGRDLGPALDVGTAMTRKFLKPNGEFVYRMTSRPLTPEEWADPEHKAQREAFDKSVHEHLGPGYTWDEIDADPEVATPVFEAYADDYEQQKRVPDIDDAEADVYDQYIGAEVLLDSGDQKLTGKVARRKRDRDGNLKGTRHSNRILDTRTYEVEFPDGRVAEYSANVIAESMYAQCDAEGNQFLLLKAICDHCKNGHAVEKADMFVEDGGLGSNHHKKKTTRGWFLLVEWKDGSTSWEKLADLKESNPIEVAEYPVAQGIQDEPAFAWWVPYVLKRCDYIISKINTTYHKRTHKYGIEVPKTIAEALAIDKKNGNTLWEDAIN
jgi:hypothetical protein